MVYEVKKGMPVNRIDTPALLLDYDRLQDNINRMADFFSRHPAALRPHIKTHKCVQIAKRQIAAGAVGITCAKVSEAEVFANAGFDDILIANQVTGYTKLDRLTEVARRCNLMVAVDDAQNVNELNQACRGKGIDMRVLVEVDIGMERCGVQPGKDTLLLAKEVQSKSNLTFMGLQAYEGHLVLVEDPAEREKKVEKAFAPLQSTCRMLEEAGLKPEIISGGGTGTYDVSGSTTPLTEIQAGSYVFMDYTYRKIRPEFQSALHISSTVVSRPVPERLVTDAGLKSMTSEFGWPVLVDGLHAEVKYLSEEHAVLILQKPQKVELSGGDLVQFVPSHVCTTVNLHDTYYVHQQGSLIETWPVDARGCTQ